MEAGLEVQPIPHETGEELPTKNQKLHFSIYVQNLNP